MSDPDKIAQEIAAVAREAGRILARMQAERPVADLKADASPVTAADRASEARILARLAQAFPGVPVVSEENPPSQTAADCPRFFLVDPLDGTRAFIQGSAEFCVAIALVEAGVPVAGALHAPVADETFWAGERASMAGSNLASGGPLAIVPRVEGRAQRIGLASELHGDAQSERMLADLGVEQVIRMSSALKFVLLANGKADFYPRRGRTMQWDVAAGDAILRAQGGGVLDDAGALLRYGRGPNGWESPPFLAVRDHAGWRRSG